ncbi:MULTISPECIES: hypothetical protein [Actinoalloteichus]|uniref:Beta-ketoacyl synthase N-terminal domain-containing protein n=1 Tax=Actinoalloteichus fjordicus TaxID=1612552 RepID=A0AAC9PQP5_9PSEU|nr:MULTISPECIES: hypothetical protein [Actinoalloteichus]APU13369.1 hypothetical protein UA74_06480 [Actinoalloteichus fjordicus]APU19319.1 hypothetical protein UA75_06480 [Actinoalloteichus sp. GBA129-24]
MTAATGSGPASSAPVTDAPVPQGVLEVVEAACLLPWGAAAAGLPGAAERALPPLPGFAMSRFSPLVAETARRLLRAAAARAPIDGGATGIVLATLFGDSTTVDQHTRRQLRGLPHNPLFFYESVHSAGVGMVGIEHGISGPVSCLSLRRDFTAEALASADLQLDDDGVEQVLLIGVELAPTERTRAVHRQWAAADRGESLPADDVGVALLLRRPRDHDAVVTDGAVPDDEQATALPGRRPRPAGNTTGLLPAPGDSERELLGHLAGLVAVCSALDRVRASDLTGSLLVRSTSDFRPHS